MNSGSPIQNNVKNDKITTMFQSFGHVILTTILVIFHSFYHMITTATAIVIIWFCLAILLIFIFTFQSIKNSIPTSNHSEDKNGKVLPTAYCLLLGTLWGVSSFLLFPHQNETIQIVFALTITCAAVVGLTLKCRPYWAFFLYETLVIIPLLIQFLPLNTSNKIALATLVLLLYLTCLLCGKIKNINLENNEKLETILSQEQEKSYYSNYCLQNILDNSYFGTVHFTTSGIITECNSFFAKIIGKDKNELINQDIFKELSNDELIKSIRQALKDGFGSFQGEYKVAKTGLTTHFKIQLKAIKSSTGKTLGAVGILEDKTEAILFEQKIEHQARYDTLTGLPNRALILNQLEQELARAERHELYGALLFVDLDNFKTINDSLGHFAGDKLLKKVANRLKNNLRKEDLAGRMGGDEFVILLPHLNDRIEGTAQKSQNVAKKLANLLADPILIEGHELTVTPSVGISLFPEQEKTAIDILKQADTAMNQAKAAGRNTIQFFQPSMQKAADKRLQLNSDIRKAIRNEELSMHFQPQVMADGSIVGAEGLLRWTHPVRGMIPPLEFIATAEETGIIVEIGNWVLRDVCQTIKRWEEQSLITDKQTIAVNISPLEFSTPDFTARVSRIIEETGIAPHHLDIELTEGSLISSVSETIEKINTLRDLGIKFSVDDFGTGYSSLSYLKSLPLHTLKIDRSFVNDIRPNSNDVMLVEIIITMAKSLGLEIVAEGVETTDELAYLLEKGCSIFQGYYFSKPLPLSDFSAILEKGKLAITDKK